MGAPLSKRLDVAVKEFLSEVDYDLSKELDASTAEEPAEAKKFRLMCRKAMHEALVAAGILVR